MDVPQLWAYSAAGAVATVLVWSAFRPPRSRRRFALHALLVCIALLLAAMVLPGLEPWPNRIQAPCVANLKQIQRAKAEWAREFNKTATDVPAIAESINLTFSGPLPLEKQIVHYLIEKETLLVLDNYEHLFNSIDLIKEILNQACNVKMLVTSREPLGIPGEWLFEVQGLPVPRAITGAVETNSAVTLFIQSARRASQNYRLKNEDLPAIINICRSVEGMPLGIELAATWVRLLTCQEIAKEIGKSLDFLTVSLRGIPERHRSLKAVFDHSWKLLSGEEQTISRRLSVFRGGFTRSAAEYVAGASLGLLANLVSKSLVHRSEGERYELHEAVRQFAAAHLALHPSYGMIRDKHCHYYLIMLRDQECPLKSAAQREAIHLLTGEIDNIREGWAWAVEREFFLLITEALPSLGWLCNVIGWLQEGINQIEPVVQLYGGEQMPMSSCGGHLGRRSPSKASSLFDRAGSMWR